MSKDIREGHSTPITVFQEEMPAKKGIALYSQSNPIIMANRPEVLWKGTKS